METKRIKTYEEALEKLGIKHFDESGLTPDEVAYKKLKIITVALNDGWVTRFDENSASFSQQQKTEQTVQGNAVTDDLTS